MDDKAQVTCCVLALVYFSLLVEGVRLSMVVISSGASYAALMDSVCFRRNIMSTNVY